MLKGEGLWCPLHKMATIIKDLQAFGLNAEIRNPTRNCRKGSADIPNISGFSYCTIARALVEGFGNFGHAKGGALAATHQQKPSHSFVTELSRPAVMLSFLEDKPMSASNQETQNSKHPGVKPLSAGINIVKHMVEDLGTHTHKNT